MADSADASVVVELLADVSNFIKDVEKAANSLGVSVVKSAQDIDESLTKTSNDMKDFAGKAEEHGKEAGEGFGRGLLLGFGAMATEFLLRMKETIQEASEYATNLVSSTLITGDTTTRLQQFEYMMRSVGIDAQNVQYQLTFFQRRIEETAQKAKDTSSIFYQLGLNVKNMVGKDAITNIEAVADRIAGLKDAQMQAYAATELFSSRYGQKLLPVLAEGKRGIEDLMNKAKEMGALIPPEAILALADYDSAMRRLDQTVRAFFAIMSEPFVSAMTRSADTMAKFLTALENLTPLDRLLLTVGLLTAAFVGLESGLEMLKSVFQSARWITEFVDAAKLLARPLEVIAALAGIVAAAWISNFANFRQAFEPVIADFQNEFGSAKDAVDGFTKFLKTEFGPVFAELSKDLAPLVQQFADFVDGIIRNKTLWDELAKSLELIGTALIDLLKFLGNVIKYFDSWGPLVGALVGPALLPKLFSLISSLSTAFQMMGIRVASLVIEGLRPLLVCFTGMPGVVGGATRALYGFSTAEALVTGGINILLGVLITLIFTNEKVRKVFLEIADVIGRIIMHAVAELIRSLSDLIFAFGQLGEVEAKVLPFLKPIADGFESIAVKGYEAANAIDKAANAQDNYNRRAAQHKGTKHEPPSAPPSHHGPNALRQPQGRGQASNAAADWTTAIRDKIAEVEFHLKEAQSLTEHWANAFKALGEIDSIARVKMAVHDLTEELKAQHDVIGQQSRVAAAYGSAAEEALHRAHSATNAKQKAEYLKSYYDFKTQELNADRSIETEEQKLLDIQKQRRTVEYDYQKTVASDEYNSNQQRLAAANQMLFLAREKHLGLQAERDALSEILAIEKEISDTEKSIADARTTHAKDLADYQKQRYDLSNPGQSKAKAVTDAMFDIQIANAAVGEAMHAHDAAERELTELEKRHITSGRDWDAAVVQEIQTREALTRTQDDARLANLKYQIALQQTSDSVLAVRNAFDDILKSTAGPLYDLFQGLKGNVSDLASGLAELFKKSKAYHDIQVVLADVTDKLAQVFDAFRPIIDMLLGVVAGVVNIFIALFNVVGDILRLFGIHIQRLQAVNTKLDEMTKQTAKAVPLLQITHDLPTMNEYNKGKWADLLAKQDAQNNQLKNQSDILDQGFSQSLEKFGEMVGWLIGIHMILRIIAGQSMLGGGGGGFFGWLGNLLGLNKHSASAAAATTASTAAATAAASTATAAAQMSQEQAQQKLSQIASATQDTAQSAKTTADVATGANQSGAANTASNISKIAGGIGDVFGIMQGFQQGGVFGGMQAGFSADQLALLLGATGPAGALIGAITGIGTLLFGGGSGHSLFGPHWAPGTYPDRDPNTQQAFGQGIANFLGSGYNGAKADMVNGKAFFEDPKMNAMLGGKGEAQFLTEWIASHAGAASGLLSPEELKLFSNLNESKPISGGKDGTMYLSNGQKVNWQTLINDAQDAIQKIVDVFEGGALNLNDVLNGANGMDLGSLYGNGTVTAEGGYSLYPGAPIRPIGGGGGGVPIGVPEPGSGGGTGVNPPPFHGGGDGGGRITQVYIENVNGADPAYLKTAFKQIFDDIARDQARTAQMAYANRQFLVGNDGVV